MVSTGFNDVIGSWKIIEMASPRTLRISASGSSSRSRPSKITRPPTVRPGGDAIRRRIDSDVTLLPQPDSPTTASVSPRPTENDTPSTARTTPSRVKKYVFMPSTSSSGAAGVGPNSFGRIGPSRIALMTSHAPRETRVERIAHAVAEQIHREHRERQADAGKNNEVARDLDEAPSLGHDVAPARNIGRRAGADERQYRLGDHRRSADIGSLHEQRRDDVGQDVAHEDARQGRAGRDRGFDVRLLAQAEHEAPNQAHDPRDLRQRDGDDHVADARLGQRHQRNGEQHRGD